MVNLLIGNGDAHLKNWSVIYRDGITPQLAPAYDLVSTIHYVSNDRLALNLGGEKRFEAINETHFDRLARRMEAPPKFVLDVVRGNGGHRAEKVARRHPRCRSAETIARGPLPALGRAFGFAADTAVVHAARMALGAGFRATSLQKHKLSLFHHPHAAAFHLCA